MRLCLFHNKSTARDPLNLPDTQGPVVTLQEKLFVPVKEHPDVSDEFYFLILNCSCLQVPGHEHSTCPNVLKSVLRCRMSGYFYICNAAFWFSSI